MAALACYNPAKATKIMLSKYEKSPPSLSVHIYPSHWTLNDSKPLSYTSALSSLLKSIHDRILPIDLLAVLEERKVPFYEGCMIVEVNKHVNDPNNQAKNPEEKPTKKDVARDRRVLWPTSESLFLDIANINTKNGSNMTDMDSLEVESNILLATAPPLCLTPDPIVSRIANAALIAGQPEGSGKTLSLGTKRKRFGDSTEDAALREKRAKLLSVMDPRAGKPAVPRGVSRFDLMLKARDKKASEQQAQAAQHAAAQQPTLAAPQAAPPAVTQLPIPAAVSVAVVTAADNGDKTAPKKKPPPKPKKAMSIPKPEPQQGLLGLALPAQARQQLQSGAGPVPPPPINTNVRAPSVATTISAGPSATPASAGPKKKANARPPARPTVPISQTGAAAAMAAAAAANRPGSSVAPSPSPASSNIPLAALAQNAAASQPPKKKAKPNTAPSRAPSHPGPGPSSVGSAQTSPQSGAIGNGIGMPDGAGQPAAGFPAHFAALNPQQQQYYATALANATNPSHMGNTPNAPNMSSLPGMAPVGQVASQMMANGQPGNMAMLAAQQAFYGNIASGNTQQRAAAATTFQGPVTDDVLNRAVLMYTQSYYGGITLSDGDRANLGAILQASQGDPRLPRAIALARQTLTGGGAVPGRAVPPGQVNIPSQQQPQLLLQQPQPQLPNSTPSQHRMPTPAMQNQRGPTPGMAPPHATPGMPAQRMPTPALQGQQRIATPGSQNAATPAMMPSNAQLNPRATPNPQQQRLVQQAQQAQAQQARLGVPGQVPISGQQGRATPNPQTAPTPRMAQQWSPQQLTPQQMQQYQIQQQQIAAQQQFVQQQQHQQVGQQQPQRNNVPNGATNLQAIANIINNNPNLLPQFLSRIPAANKAAFLGMLAPQVQHQAQISLAQAVAQAQAQQQQQQSQQQPQPQQFPGQFGQGQQGQPMQWPPGYPMNGMWPQQGQQQ